MEPQDADTNSNRLWVDLSALAESKVFAVLPGLLRNMFEETLRDSEHLEDDTDQIKVILPSDDEWQTKIYYQLVEKQRLCDANGEGEEVMPETLKEEKPAKLNAWNIIQRPKSLQCDISNGCYQRKEKTSGPGPITWTISDISKSGCLISNPPLDVVFDDEQEMRRVYTLIYDVFRYKSILIQALNNVNFFQVFPKLHENQALVWLLLYDLYYRRFKKRDDRTAKAAYKLFDMSGISFAENALWSQRTKLAAAVTRIRVQNSALSLSEMLPQHLKDERVTEIAQKAPVTCWVNPRKVEDVEALCGQIENEFGLKIVRHLSQLGKQNYKWDVHCKHILAFHPTLRPMLAKSSLVRSKKLIIQDRSFCLGPATFERQLTSLELCGSVIQTHISSPRSTAYLAAILSHNERIKKLIAFSAGKRKAEYEEFFNELGIDNIEIVSDRLIDSPPDASYMEEVVAVFATPPNSYSAVADPIDLVCCRGGDLTMLKVLTEFSDTKETRERVANILDEQRRTLKFSMSRPQIQFVLYETHSEVETENATMVIAALTEMNRIAKLHHAILQGKLTQSNTNVISQIDENLETDDVNNNENVDQGSTVVGKTSIVSRLPFVENEEHILETITVPDTDIFHMEELPSLCSNEVGCLNEMKDGCYLALLQRKEIIRLDDKYMIKMAENRGLFGSTTSTSMKSKSSKNSKKKLAAEAEKKPKKKAKSIEIARIAAPTNTSLRHQTICPIDTCCSKCDETSSVSLSDRKYRRWWSEATRHIINLKVNLIKQKLLPSSKLKQNDVQTYSNTFAYNKSSIDEIAAKINTMHKFPLFPKLHLTRDCGIEKVPILLAIAKVEFHT